MRLRRQLLALLASVALLAILVPSASAAGPGPGPSPKWTLYYYSGDNGPFTMPAKPKGGSIATFAFDLAPNQALLMSSDREYLKKGNLFGNTVTATLAIKAPKGTTFVGYDTDCATLPTVRFYFHTTNTALGESAYWWSNPVSISLAALFASGPHGATLSVSMDPANWSDRAGGFGDVDGAHLAAFQASASSVTEIGLSFGSGCTFAFGDGSNPAGAVFNLVKFSTQPAHHGGGGPHGGGPK